MDDWDVKWELLVADAWDDEELKNRLLSDPMKVCEERGIYPPEGVKICVVANTKDTLNLVLPEAPSEDELSSEDLENVAGGYACIQARCAPQGPQGCCQRCSGQIRCGGQPPRCGGQPPRCGGQPPRCGGQPRCGRCH